MDRQLLNRLAARQWNVVTRAQLLAVGFTRAAIDSALRRGELRAIHRGVYAIGPAALSDEGVWLAAVLACGGHAALSHQAAARLWRMRVPRGEDSVHVTVTRGHPRPAGVVVHRATSLTRADVAVERGIVVTTPARTVIDCAATLTYQELRALADHGVRLDAAAVRRALARAPGRPGATAVARLLSDGLATRSTLERAFVRLCREAALPMPLLNHRVLGAERDAVWPEHRLVVEVDGGAFHLPKPARERDYERDADLIAAGWRVVRFSYDQVVHEPRAVAARLVRLLAT